MKRLSFLSVAVVLLSACSEAPSAPEISVDPIAVFGVEPMPFFPSATNELNAATHHLEVIGEAFGSLCVPPDECVPDDFKPGYVHPTVGKLGAMVNELHALDDRVNAVLGVEPEPFEPPPEFDAAVVATFGAAKNVFIQAYLAKAGTEPSPFRDDLIPAFEAVDLAAWAIMVSVDESGYCPTTEEGVSQCVFPTDVMPLPSGP
jgi:hypothetical protein